MGEFLEPDDPMPDFVPARKSALPDAGFNDIFGASVEQMRATDLTSSETDNKRAAFAEIQNAVKGVFGGDAKRMSEAMASLPVPELDGISPEQQVRMSVGSAYDRAWLARYKAFRNSQAPEIRATIPDPDRIDARAREIALERYTGAEEVIGQARGFGDGTAKFLGGMTGAMTDPVNIASMVVFHKPMTTFKGAVAYGAVTSGATEAVLQPFVQSYREEVGLPAGWDIGFQNVFYATVGGGAFGAVEGGLIKLGQAIDARKRKGIATVIDDQVGGIIARYEAGELDPEGVKEEFAALAQREPAFAAAVEISERAAAAQDVDGTNPFGLSPEAIEAHRARLANAEADALDVPRPFGEEEVPAAPPAAAPVVPPEWGALGLEVVDYRAIARDAKRFQFKAADGDGLNDALKDVTEWQPERAGALLVWEANDGTRFVANGHQRHGLASRLMEGGADPISGPAFVLREADGVTAEDAMVRGALVNIGEGSGTSLDAARILRASPDTATTLPPRSPLVREARGLQALSDDAFGLVVNEQVSARNAALVGREVTDPALQAQIALALQRVDPRTATEASSIIRDLQSAPVVEGVTIDLFGESGFKQALIAERARVKAAVLNLLASDKRAFGTLTKRADRIEAEGNALDTARNADVEMQAARLAERIEREAHVKGEISDALNAAARAVADGEPAVQAARGLVEALAGNGERSRAGSGADAPGRGADQPANPRARGAAGSRLGTGLTDLLAGDAGGAGRAVRAYEAAAVAADEFGPEVAGLVSKLAEAPQPMPGRLVAAAVQFEGKVYTGKTHVDAVRAAETATGKTVADLGEGPGGARGGFVDGTGRFLGREDPDALMGALAAGQITDPVTRRMYEMRTRKSEPVSLVSDAVDFTRTGTEGGLFARSLNMNELEFSAELSRMQTLFVKDEVAAVGRALAEAAACAGGVPMAGLGQLAAGSAVGLGVGFAFGGMMLAQGSPEKRAERYDAYVDTAPEMAGERTERQKARNMAAMRKETRGSYYDHKSLREQTTEVYRHDLSQLEPVSQFHANLWGERLTGVDAGFLDDMLHHESSGDWTARPELGSAYGGFQFIESTWRRMMREKGPGYGLKLDPFAKKGTPEYDALMELRSDPRWGTIMAGEYAKENAQHLERALGRPVTQKEGYLAHFLGSGTALKLLRADPAAPAADMLPAEARNNMNVFYVNGDVTRPRTVKQVIARQTSDFANEPLFPRALEVAGGAL